MRVIGTAGHVDHGKSTLVKRLTGRDPDRLAEEKARSLTIDLGFAWFDLDGETVGVVDVPGHRDFIENMLAGVGGIDAVLLVIAADEGVMPQTREHLAILDLLDVGLGIVLLTKTDLIDDPDWLDLIELDVREVLAGTALAESPILRVSAKTGDGLPDMLDTLSQMLADLDPRTDLQRPRLPIDRVFTVSGFGTVVTGTLTGGALRIGDEVEIDEKNGRVRGLQSYEQTIEVAYPGSRVAVNVAGVDRSDVSRGHVLAKPGTVRPTLLADVYFRHLADAPRPLKHNAEVKVFSGAASAVARVRLLEGDTLAPGAAGWLQLKLASHMPLSDRDRFILRYPSPKTTIGGGLVVDAHPGRQHKRNQPRVIAALQTRLDGTPAERVAQAADFAEPVPLSTLRAATGYENISAAIDEASAEGLIVAFPGNRYMATARYTALLAELANTLGEFHAANPLRLGMPREELRSRLGVKGATFDGLLAGHGRIEDAGPLLRLPGHEIRFSESQEADARALLEALAANPTTPPSYKEALDAVGEDVLRALIDLGEVVQVEADVIFSRDAYDALTEGVLAMIDAEEEVTAKTIRDRYQTSRKYAIALLEHLDANRITRRVGDRRVRA